MRKTRVMIYVQHLLGIGHLKRTVTIARAIAASGCETTVVSGGPIVEFMDYGEAGWRQLPPLRASEDFSQLLDEHGRPIDNSFRAARRETLLNHYRELQPDILITELFPLGRRQMRYELLPLLHEAKSMRHPPIIAASVRDILQQRSTERVAEALQWFDRYYDRLLVHADPAIIRLEASMPAVTRIADRVHYTGYVVDLGRRPSEPTDCGHSDVLVSAGGGAVGIRLLRAAIAARPLTVFHQRPWLLLTGSGMPQFQVDALRDDVLPGIEVERARSDFTTLLHQAKLSISQCGYNTVMDIVDTGARAVVVPFAGNGETEQTTRAKLWAERKAVTVVAEKDLMPETLAHAIDRTAAKSAFDATGINRDGAQQTARLVQSWANGREAAQ